jgi:putative tryptophan/tyrosine transport system substrate-binding protein
MRRRDFIASLGAAGACAPVWPVAAQALEPAMPVIGFLNGVSAAGYELYVTEFLRGLGEEGFIDGRNVAIEYRWAERRFERLPALATDLVSRRVAVIVAAGTPDAAMAAKSATSSIPIVFIVGDDPVGMGLVASYNRPGGNATGIVALSGEIAAKRLSLLRELLPETRIVGYLNNQFAVTNLEVGSLQSAARALGLALHEVDVASEKEFGAAFAAIDRLRVGALFVSADTLFLNQRERVAALAAQSRIPAIYAWRDSAVAGGLISYGSNPLYFYYQIGIYAGRILNGAKPADLPVIQPTKFELVLNLKTAKALGLTIPPNLLAIADEVIE